MPETPRMGPRLTQHAATSTVLWGLQTPVGPALMPKESVRGTRRQAQTPRLLGDVQTLTDGVLGSGLGDPRSPRRPLPSGSVGPPFAPFPSYLFDPRVEPELPERHF